MNKQKSKYLTYFANLFYNLHILFFCMDKLIYLDVDMRQYKLHLIIFLFLILYKYNCNLLLLQKEIRYALQSSQIRF